MLGALTSSDIFVFWVIFFFVLFGLAFLAWFSWRLTHRIVDPSPYTGLPLRRGSDINDYTADKIHQYLFSLQQYDNPLFDLKKSSYCNETGRIFPNSLTRLEAIRVDWSFIQKRHKGNYVSWGSLTRDQQVALKKEHGNMFGFNTGFSSPTANPRLIEPEYAFAKPGPLYVDVNTHYLLGWKEVPGTPFEVLIVKKPLNIILSQPE